MQDPVKDYTRALASLRKYFACDQDFFIRPLTEYNWLIQTNEGISILSYWKDDTARTDAVIVNKDGAPLVYEAKDYTMVVAIDCVKIAFLFANKNGGNR